MALLRGVLSEILHDLWRTVKQVGAAGTVLHLTCGKFLVAGSGWDAFCRVVFRRDLLHCHQENAGILPSLDRGGFLPNPLQFTI